MLIFVSETTKPNYIALSSDISGSKISGASMIGKTVYTTDDQKWYIINNDLTLSDYSASLKKSVVFSVEGILKVEGNPLRIYNDSGVSRTIQKVRISVSIAPVGASIIADIHKNGTTIFTTQSNRPTILASQTTGITTTIDDAVWEDGTYLTLEVDQVGSSTAGSYLSMQILFTE